MALVAAVLATLAVPGETNAQRITVRDIAGRQVTLPGPARRIVIDDARYLIALSLIHPEPVSLLAGWPRDINRLGTQTYERYRAHFPRLASLPQTSSSAGTFSIESALAARPDLVIYTLGLGPSQAELRQFERAGVPVVFIDFFSQPFDNLETSLAILGDVTGRRSEADRFIQFRRVRMNRISERLKGVRTRPNVFLEAHAGISEDCCNSPGKGNIGNYITFVGGHNIGADVLPGPSGRLNLEYVLSRDPDVYIATGGSHLERTGGLVLGRGYTPQRARAALAAMAGRRGIAQLTAVRSGRTFGLSHELLNSPLDIVAVEALARWIHPELFGDLDPDATLRQINSTFLAVPLDGTHWVSLR